MFKVCNYSLILEKREGWGVSMDGRCLQVGNWALPSLGPVINGHFPLLDIDFLNDSNDNYSFASGIIFFWRLVQQLINFLVPGY